jgi:hypothetical protein
MSHRHHKQEPAVMVPADRQFYSIAASRGKDTEKGFKAVQRAFGVGKKF